MGSGGAAKVHRKGWTSVTVLRLFDGRIFIILALGTVAAVATGGLAAANTVPTAKAGDGAGTVSGYTVSAIHYTLDAANPANIDAVQFTLDTAPGSTSVITMQLVSAGGPWYSSCGTPNGSTTTFTCTTTSPSQATVTTANELRLVVAD